MCKYNFYLFHYSSTTRTCYTKAWKAIELTAIKMQERRYEHKKTDQYKRYFCCNEERTSACLAPIEYILRWLLISLLFVFVSFRLYLCRKILQYSMIYDTINLSIFINSFWQKITSSSYHSEKELLWIIKNYFPLFSCCLQHCFFL